MQNPDPIKHAIVAADAVIFTTVAGVLSTFLIDIQTNPLYEGKKAFPGGLVRPEESGEEAVERIVRNKAHIPARAVHFEMLGAYSKVDRDARGRVVSIAYLGLIREAEVPHEARALCVPFTRAKGLGYDHTEMGRDALERLRHALTETTIAQKLLPESFTITEMHALFETVLGKGIDKRNFLKKIKSLDIIHETGEMVTGKKNRPAKLFAFKKQNVEHLDIF